MNPGYSKKRIKAQELETQRLASGEQLESWATRVERWGRVRFRSGKEFAAAGVQTVAEAYWEVVLRYESALTSLDVKWRLEIGGQAFRITAVENIDMGNRWLRLRCIEDV